MKGYYLYYYGEDGNRHRSHIEFKSDIEAVDYAREAWINYFMVQDSSTDYIVWHL